MIYLGILYLERNEFYRRQKFVHNEISGRLEKPESGSGTGTGTGTGTGIRTIKVDDIQLFYFS